MATPRSPRKKRTSEEKRAAEAPYRLDAKAFSKHLKDIVTRFNAIIALTTALAAAGKGAYLAFPNPNQPGTFIPYNRRHNKSAQAMFARDLKELKKYLSVSRKKERAPVHPSSFSGVYTPAYAAQALLAFFTQGADGFGDVVPQQWRDRINSPGFRMPADPFDQETIQLARQGILRLWDETTGVKRETGRIQGRLMDNLPMVKQGYLLRNTITMLFYMYAHAQNLQRPGDGRFARSDALMNQVFGGAIPAAFFSWKIDVGKKKIKRVRQPDGTVAQVQVDDLKTQKMPMDQAVATRRIAAAMNTYDVVRSSFPHFNPADFENYFYQNIASANYYSRDDLLASGDAGLTQIADALAREDVKAQMLQEHMIVVHVKEIWHEILEPGRKEQRDARKKAADAAKKAAKAAGLVA